jgi:hypothetical protein
MHREYFKSHLSGNGRSHSERVHEWRHSDLQHKLLNLLIAGPPGVADHALWTLVLSGAGERNSWFNLKQHMADLGRGFHWFISGIRESVPKLSPRERGRISITDTDI